VLEALVRHISDSFTHNVNKDFKNGSDN